jgi:hydroxypyruvate reductase
MAAALDEILGDRLAAAILSSSATGEPAYASLAEHHFNDRWQVFAGGHPLPNEASLRAAQAAFELLRRADAERGLVIFLISGGGSAMIEWPRDEQTTLEELREANRVLVSCGATIAEINAVRRAVSLIKGGGLAARAPRADQVSLIVSDTNVGDERDVASGPTFERAPDALNAERVVRRYGLASRLPAPILRAINQPPEQGAETARHSLRKHHVLLDNGRAIAAAAEAARSRGFTVEVARDLVEQPIAEGCAQLLSRLFDLGQRTAGEGRAVCLISGGEFACPVNGSGIGGRNSETALRCAIGLDEHERAARQKKPMAAHVVVLSAGTDGIDGNSAGAGALADETTLARARALGLDAHSFLARSDAYTFFEALGDLLMSGPTGTNVRDLRIALAC